MTVSTPSVSSVLRQIAATRLAGADAHEDDFAGPLHTAARAWDAAALTAAAVEQGVPLDEDGSGMPLDPSSVLRAADDVDAGTVSEPLTVESVLERAAAVRRAQRDPAPDGMGGWSYEEAHVARCSPSTATCSASSRRRTGTALLGRSLGPP